MSASAARFEISPLRKCAQCHRVFEVSYLAPRQLYCTPACGRAAYAARARRTPDTMECVRCGLPFVPGAWPRKYCGEECKVLAGRERTKAAKQASRRPPPAGVRTVTCCVCGERGHAGKTCLKRRTP